MVRNDATAFKNFIYDKSGMRKNSWGGGGGMKKVTYFYSKMGASGDWRRVVIKIRFLTVKV